MPKKSPGSFAFECQLLDIEWGVPFPQIQFAFCWNGRFEMKDGGQQPGVPTGRVVSQRAFKQLEEMGRWPPSGKHLSVSPLRARTLKGTGLGW
jgi:hypothetical protein